MSHMQPLPQPTRAPSLAWLWCLITGIFAFGAGLTFGVAFGVASVHPAPVTTRAATTSSSPARTTTQAAPPRPASTITDGTWTVGVDIQPGVYRVTEKVTGMCYWEITKTGSNGNIVDNAIVEGGFPSVTLKKGTDFETSQCGEWVRK